MTSITKWSNRRDNEPCHRLDSHQLNSMLPGPALPRTCPAWNTGVSWLSPLGHSRVSAFVWERLVGPERDARCLRAHGARPVPERSPAWTHGSLFLPGLGRQSLRLVFRTRRSALVRPVAAGLTRPAPQELRERPPSLTEWPFEETCTPRRNQHTRAPVCLNPYAREFRSRAFPADAVWRQMRMRGLAREVDPNDQISRAACRPVSLGSGLPAAASPRQPVFEIWHSFQPIVIILIDSVP
jgi:hypothetical protein